MKIIVLIFFISVITSCSPTSSDKPPRPDKIRMVQRTADTSFADIEQGIDAIEEDSSLVIMWHKPINIVNIETYNIYKSDDPEGIVNFNRITTTDLLFTDTVYFDRNLNLETLYSYFVTAVDEDGQESLPSDTVQYQLLEQAKLQVPADEALFTDPSEIVFQGTFTNGIAQSAILRIERQVGATFKELIYLQYKPNFDNYDGTVQFMLTEETLREFFVSGQSYIWRIDLVRDLSFWGSESSTRTFRISWGS